LFKDTILFNRYSGEYVPFREINFYSRIDNEDYRVSIRKSLIESDELLTFITLTMLGFLLLGLFLLYFFQRKISRKIWNPFYSTLSHAKSFDLKADHELKVQDDDIQEFRELNDVLIKMTEKMRKDYRNLKEFTENASHEIQTPLALINGRVEQLIQQKNFSEEQMYWIQEIYNSSIRLSKLNQALLLLSKIENEQFHETKSVNFNELIKNKVSEYEDVLTHKQIELIIVQSSILAIEMNLDLADVLVTNLISNAIRHNMSNGKIKVYLNEREVRLENTGYPIKNDSEQMFERFKKGQNQSGSLGLGLAIVKKICNNYNLNIKYDIRESIHTISIHKNIDS